LQRTLKDRVCEQSRFFFLQELKYNITRKTATGALSTVDKYLWKVHSHLEVRGQHMLWSLYAIRYIEQQWENILHIPGGCWHPMC